MRKNLAKVWDKRIKAFEASGLSAQAFCKQQKISTSSFYAWRAKLKTQDDQKGSPSKQAQSPKFVEVLSPPMKPQAQGSLTLRVDDRFCVELVAGFDESLLLKTLKLLSKL